MQYPERSYKPSHFNEPTEGYHDAPDPIGRIRRDLKAQRDGIANGVVDHKTAVFNALLVLEEIVNYIDSQGLTDRNK